MADTRSASSAEVQHFFPGLDEDIVEAAKDTRSELTPEGIPDTVLDLGALDAALDGDTFFAVHGLAGDEVLGDKHVLLAFCNEYTWVFVRLKHRVRPAPGSAPSTTTASASTSSPPIAAASTTATAPCGYTPAAHTSTWICE